MTHKKSHSGSNRKKGCAGSCTSKSMGIASIWDCLIQISGPGSATLYAVLFQAHSQWVSLTMVQSKRTKLTFPLPTLEFREGQSHFPRSSKKCHFGSHWLWLDYVTMLEPVTVAGRWQTPCWFKPIRIHSLEPSWTHSDETIAGKGCFPKGNVDSCFQRRGN